MPHSTARPPSTSGMHSMQALPTVIATRAHALMAGSGIDQRNAPRITELTSTSLLLKICSKLLQVSGRCFSQITQPERFEVS